MYTTTQLISGERLQNVADVYIGTTYYFQYNPMMTPQIEKQKHLADFNRQMPYNNPRIVFCYGDLLREFQKIIDWFVNPFILITHNSDANIVNEPTVNAILNHPKVLRWHAQNVGYLHGHPKLYFLPIGIANRQWPHGNLEMFEYVFNNYNLPMVKSRGVYMNFKIETNKEKRLKCYEELSNLVEYLPMVSPMENLLRMIQYRYCICPEGNGLDTHRMWECFYLRIVPIMLRTPFSVNIQQKTGLPMILLNTWSEFSNTVLDEYTYTRIDFDSCHTHLTLKHYIQQIIAYPHENNKSP